MTITFNTLIHITIQFPKNRIKRNRFIVSACSIYQINWPLTTLLMEQLKKKTIEISIHKQMKPNQTRNRNRNERKTETQTLGQRETINLLERFLLYLTE